MQGTNKLFILPTNPHIRTNAEIWAELERLHSLLNRGPVDTACGDSNRLAIEAAISALITRPTLEQVTNEHEDDGDYILSATLTALEWLHEDGPAPSDDWMSLQAA